VSCLKGPRSIRPGDRCATTRCTCHPDARRLFKGPVRPAHESAAADGIERPDLYARQSAYVAPRHAVMRRIIERGVAEGSIRADVDPEWVIAMLAAPVIFFSGR